MTLFPLGRTLFTPGALEAVEQHSIDLVALLRRHAHGDWGDLDDHDRKENDLSVRVGLRIVSAYVVASGIKLWIITEWDRSVTTILTPSEY